MIITCETCGTSFRLKSSMVNESGSKVRCSKCQHVFIVYPPSSMPDSSSAYQPGKRVEDDISPGAFGTGESKGEDRDAMMEGETITDMEALRDSDKDAARMKEGDTISDLEEMIDEDVSEITRRDVSEDSNLFDEESSLFAESDEDEISLSDLEVGPASEIISLEDLESGTDSGDILDLDALTSEAETPAFEDETAEIDFEDMTRTTTEDEGFFEEAEEMEAAPFEETTEMESVSEIDFEDMTKTTEDEDIFGDAEVEAEEPEADVEAFEAYETQPLAEDFAAEPEEPEKEMEGGFDTQLDDFELDKKPEEEKPSASADEETGGKKAAEPKEDSEEKPSGETEDFELDFEDELEKALGEEEGEEEEAFDLDLDEATEKAEAEDADLEEFDLDIESELEEGEPVTETADEEDLGLDLELDEYDLDLVESQGEEETADFEGDEFDLDLDLESEAESAETDVDGEKEFDLDLDLAPEGEEAEAPEASGDEFELDLDLEPEGEEAPSAEAEEEFDLDLDLGADEETVGEGEAQAATGEETGKTEEFDLSEIEDFLEEEAPATESTQTMEESAELDLELSTEAEDETLESETDMATETDLDLETMLDEEEEARFGDEGGKDVSLEAVGESEAPAEAEYEMETAAAAAEETVEEFPREADHKVMPPPVSEPKITRARKSRVKPVLVTILALIILGALAFGGYMYFFGPEKGPAVFDQGNLQIEMVPNPDYRFVNNETAGELLVVTGNVTNRYDQPRSFIQVKANLFNPAGQVIRSESAFAGNTISDSDLSSLTLETLKTQLANRGGDNNANVGLAAGQSVPFMVVFGNLPENMDEFNVEVVSSAQE